MEAKLLNNIAASTGYGNLWLYTTTEDQAAIDVVGYFNDGIDYGMHDKDVILLQLSDIVCYAAITIAGGVVTLNAMGIYA